MTHKNDDDSGARPTSAYARDKRAFVGWAATALGSVALAIGGFAHNKLWSHDVSIATVQTVQTLQEKRLDEMDKKLDEILRELRRQPIARTGP